MSYTQKQIEAATKARLAPGHKDVRYLLVQTDEEGDITYTDGFKTEAQARNYGEYMIEDEGFKAKLSFIAKITSIGKRSGVTWSKPVTK